MPPENESPRQRLGRLLGERRTEIAPRYKNKNLFAKERQINRRMVWSVETGERDTYTEDTLRDVERAYVLAPGSVQRVLDGGDLEPLGDEPAPSPPNPFASLMDEEPEGDIAWTMFPDPADRYFRAIWRTTKPYEERERKVAELRGWLKEALKPSGEESAGLPANAPDGNGSVTDLNNT